MPRDNWRVCLALPAKKLSKPAFQHFIRYCRTESSLVSLHVEPLDGTPAFNGSEFDLVIARCNAKNAANLLDPFEYTRCTTDRSAIQLLIKQVCQDLQDLSIKVSFPSYAIFQPGEQPVDKVATLFPVLGKPIAATGASEAHQMRYLETVEQLSHLPTQHAFLLQQYVRHRAVLWKIFAIGASRFWCIPRPSVYTTSELEDATTTSLAWKPDPNAFCINGSYVEFNTQQLNKQFKSQPTEHLDQTMIARCVEAVHRHSKLALFGFDLLVVHEPDDRITYQVVDLNWMQGYDGVPPEEFAHSLHDYVIERLNHNF